MHFIVDGERSKQWFAFAKNKLAQLKQSDLPVKTLVVNGYRIQLNAEQDKARITAPPAVVVNHIEMDGAAGVEQVYYAEPYGATSYPVHAKGGKDVNPVVFPYSPSDPYPVKQTLSGMRNNVSGDGVIFPSVSDFYYASLGITANYLSIYATYGIELVGIETLFANIANKPLRKIDDGANLAQLASENGGFLHGWAVSIGSALFNAYTLTLASGVYVMVTTLTDRVSRTLTEAEIKTATGYAHVSVMGVYLFEYAGKARLAIGMVGTLDFPPPSQPSGVHFFDYTLNPADETHPLPWLSYVYIGASILVANIGDPPALPGWGDVGGSLAAVSGRARTSQVYQAKFDVIADGSGGMCYLSRYVAEPDFHGTFQFRPGQVPLRLTEPILPEGMSGTAPIGANAQVWPRLYRGSDTNLCAMEKITVTDSHVTAIYQGMGTAPAPWVAVAMPVKMLLAVRPVWVSAARIVLIGLVWDDTPGREGSYFADFDSRRNPPVWTVKGRVSLLRMVRPKVGLFGAHEYSKLAQRFTGSFSVNTMFSPDSYVGS